MTTLPRNKIFAVEPDRQTNWYVITGGPSSGKTTTVNLLHKRGYKTPIEHVLPFVQDYAGREDVTAQIKIYSLLTEVYESMPFPVIYIPVLDAEKRVDFILINL